MKNYTGRFSNPVNPISAVQIFFSSVKYIKQEREFFYPDPNNPTGILKWTNNKVTSVDRKTESYEIEFEENDYWEIDESVPGRLTPIKIKGGLRKKTIYFKDKLGEFLFEIVEDSKKLIETNISLSANETANKSNISFWLDNLQKILSVISSNPHFSKYPVCSASVLSLIKYVIRKFPSLLPKAQKNISKVPITPVFGKGSLDVRFYSEILKIEDEDGNLLLDDMSRAKEILLLIAGGNIEKLRDVNFQWPKEAVYYLLNKIRLFNRPTFSIRNLVSSPDVKFNGAPTTESAFSKGYNIFTSKNHSLKTAIDNLIDRYSSYE